MLTDMRDVLPQIYENVQANAELIEAAGGSATVAELDWTEPDDEVGGVTGCKSDREQECQGAERGRGRQTVGSRDKAGMQWTRLAVAPCARNKANL